MLNEIGGLVRVLVTALALLGGSHAAGAATLKASYSLQGSRTSQLAGAPDLADIGAANRFATETVDGVARPVLTFPKGGGLSLPTTGLVDPRSHSVVILFRLADVTGYRRLLDFSDGGSDNGLYDLDGRAVLYVGGNLAVSPDTAFEENSYVQVALTSEATLAGSQWTVVYVDGVPVTAATTTQGFSLGSGVLRLFRDAPRGAGDHGEQSAGAVACVRVYDGALSADEVRQGAADPAGCPLRAAAPGRQAFKTGTYEGTTSQHLPIAFTVHGTSVQDVFFRWRAKCADGRVHMNGISLGETSVRHAHFSVGGTLDTRGHARVTGKLRGSRASGTLSRWGNSAFNTSCLARGIKWHAHVVAGRSPIF